MKEKEKQKEITFLGTLGLNILSVTLYFLLNKVFRGKFVLWEFVFVFISSIIFTIIVYYFGNKRSFEPMTYEVHSNTNILIRPLIFVAYWIMCFVLTRIFNFIIA